MTAARRRWLYATVAALFVALVLFAWHTFRAERGTDTAQPVATAQPVDTATPLAEQGVQGGTRVSPSNTLGAPVPAPETSSDAEDHADGSPIDPWWRRVPPVAGDLVPIDRFASGHVRITRAGEHLLVTISDLRVASYDAELPTVRVLLSEGAVVGERRGYWTRQGADDDLGTIPSDVGTITFDIEAPRGIPDPVRSLVLLDPDSGEVLGGAALIPTD
ncbi:hypothetical protein [Curtobacterium sp. MCBA15_008]|uniref:hypothetical protein n=1 Tax=Curtobacterium sp. MCBA15_008 TaxID=1898736 RepID=UPI0008DE16D5|nr:hypothetical protein [Curtobacterium sp. MCBA15_008]OII05408.1 hypothetical protein BIU96_07205 [Curtobacterium sp. MCBA15_008]